MTAIFIDPITQLLDFSSNLRERIIGFHFDYNEVLQEFSPPLEIFWFGLLDAVEARVRIGPW